MILRIPRWAAFGRTVPGVAVGVWLAALAAAMLVRLSTAEADDRSAAHVALLLAGGLLFALLGGIVHRWAADALLGSAFLLLSAGFGSALVALPTMITQERWAGCVVAAGGLLAASSLASVFLLFPRRIRGARQMTFGAIGVAMTLAAGQVWAQGIGSPSATFVGVLDGLSSAWMVVSLFGSLAVLFVRSWRPADRQVLAPLLIGTAVGVLPVGALYLVPRAIGLTPPVDPGTALIALAAIPTSFAYSILRHQVLGLDALLRRLLLRSSSVLISVVLFFLVWSILRIGGVVKTDNALVGALLVSVLAPVFATSMARLLNRFVYTPAQHLLRTSAPLPTDDLEALGNAIVVRLRELVPTVWAGCFVYGDHGTARAIAADGLAPASLLRLRVSAAELPGDATVVPLQRGSARIGFLAAGQRLDGSPLSHLDRETIATLGTFVAAEVDAALLRSRADDESQFRAGVTALAHDLAAAPTSMDVLTVTLAHVARLLRAKGVSLWRQTDTGWKVVVDNQSADGAPAADVLDEVLRDGLPEDVDHAWVVAHSEARTLAFGMGGDKQPRQLWVATRNANERPFGPRAERRAREIAEHASAAFQRAFERETLEAQLRQEAFYDSLTGLPNRALFLDRLDHALTRSARSSHQLAVLFIDVDRFKVINDSLGHGAGDQLLVQVGARLRDSVRGSDTVARLGGDEFTVLLEGPTAVAEAERAADRMLTALQAPFVIEGQPTYVSASIGIAGTDAFGHARDLMREADIALYRAKAAGRGRATMYEPDMGGLPAERLHLESDLHRALDNGEFVLHYQPIFSVRDARIVGLEALVRWHNPSKGLVPPSEFIPLAEDNGLIVPIGAWVLDEACRQMRAWQDEFAWLGSAKISVNLSAQQFLEPALIERIERALRRSQLDARCLQLEITESAVMHDAESTIEKLHALKALGISLAVDDFGTGYSSLAYLKRFPIDMLKIDRSFVVGLTDGGPDTAIAQSVVGLARALGMATTAEGIEDTSQWRVLQGLGYDHGQGYVYSKPLPVDAATMLLEAESTGYRPDAAA